MPAYNYKCSDGHVFESHAKMDERDTPQTCDCGKTSNRTWEGVTKAGAALNANGSGGYTTPYSDAIQLGRTFTSAKEQDAYMAERGISCVSEAEVGRIKPPKLSDNRKYQEAKQEVYREIRNHGSEVALPNGEKLKLTDQNTLEKA